MGLLQRAIETYDNMVSLAGIEREGKDIRIGFDPKFLVDVLRVVDEEDISLYMMNPANASQDINSLKSL